MFAWLASRYWNKPHPCNVLYCTLYCISLYCYCTALYCTLYCSRYRRKPHPNVGFKLPPELAAEAHMMESSNRRATSLDLPMAMR